MQPDGDAHARAGLRARAAAKLRESDELRRAAYRLEHGAARALAALLPPPLMRSKRVFDVWERRGYHVLPAHFYEPVPDRADVARSIGARSEHVGVDLAPERQLELLEELRGWKGEYDALPREPGESSDGFYVDNSLFGTVDAEILYALVRRQKPSRIFEIGSGFSTLVSARAARANEEETGAVCELVAFEPYPGQLLRRGVVGLSRIEERRLQDVPLETFAELGDGDVLFIDSSHVVATGSDVCRELLEIVPRVAPGVLVHVHDVFLPAEYPRRWLEEDHYFWTEQYLLQAFLAFNDSFEVVWAGHFMHLEHPEALRSAFASYDPARASPGSFWFRRVR
jgi:predicted O-methyltransferase YrrM